MKSSNSHVPKNIVFFEDKEAMLITGVIEFDDKQLTQIIQISSAHTKFELNEMDNGFNLKDLTSEQKATILQEKKNIVISGKEYPQELFDKKLVYLTFHALERSFQRVQQEVANMDIYIIEKIIESNKVLKAQYKGFPQLSYTLQTKNESEKFNSSISFVIHNGIARYIRVITVSLTEFSDTNTLGKSRSNQYLSDNPLLKELLERFSTD